MTDSNQPAKILLADDEHSHLKLMEVLLAESDYQLATAQDGHGVLEHLQQNTPDLIVLDINMPDVNGLDICGRIKSLRRLQGVPVILVTSHKDDRVQEMSKWVKADALIQKPLSSGNFKGRVEALLARAAQRESALTPV